MHHKEYQRIVEGAPAAVLFIHGIVGTPDHFDQLIPYIPEGISVHNMLLDGHGKTVRDFSHTSMKKWEVQVKETVDRLSMTHERIYIVAHSMGTLFAIEQATRCNRICGLFLLAVPLKLSIKPRMLRNSFQVYRGKFRDDDQEALAARACYGIESDKNPLHYLGWVPRYLELFAKIRSTRRLVKEIAVPCTVYQSFKDEMVSVRAVKYLKDHPHLSVKWLKGSGHYYYTAEDAALMIGDFQGFVDRTV